MYVFAFYMIQLALFCALGGALTAALQLWQGRSNALALVEKAQHMVTLGFGLASAVLLYALYSMDFSLEYVASYTDRLLPLFYRLTAFWAGQAGSMLFWALAVALCGSLFLFTPSYKKLTPASRLWFWIFFYGIMAFFSLILTTWSNPFMQQSPVPADGNGLNPLLQNPGMIIHPPLLFLGYGGFVIPGCLALAQCLSGGRAEEGSWLENSRVFTITGWIFLTAGIVLGAWWAYMELGWGGYWAWDPVENASLIPWLIATAALHTMIIESRRGKLGRVNVSLMWLTTISAFFATYLVRSGVVNSVHAFGDGGVGTPLLIFVLAGLALAFWIPLLAPATGKGLAGLESREGMLVLVCWILLTLALIILCATLWPVISLLWSSQPHGLEAGFYNRVCLPLGALLITMLAFCPWLSWSGGLRDKNRFCAALGIFVAGAVTLWALDYRQPTAFVAASASFAVLGSMIMCFTDSAVRGHRPTLAAHGVHLGLALLALGVAFSGPYKLERALTLKVGATETLGAYKVKLLDLRDGREPGFEYIETRLEISKDGQVLGQLGPQRRLYDKFGTMQFSEVDVIPGLGNEIYASLMGMVNGDAALVKVSVNPLVNWLWIGGTLMCLFPFLGLGRRRREQEATPPAGTDGSAGTAPVPSAAKTTAAATK